MKLVFLGAPGAGKGTHANFVSDYLGIPVISAGNLLRDAIRLGTPLGKQVKGIMDQGNLVPDEITIKLMKEKLAEPECANGVIFDGFPRTIGQAEALDGIVDVDVVISLEVPDEVIMKRMEGRLTCPKCQTTYHIVCNPPKEEGICDVCGTALGVRDDDKPEVVRNRFKVYHELTEPIKEHYSATGKLKLVSGRENVQETSDLVFKAIGIKR